MIMDSSFSINIMVEVTSSSREMLRHLKNFKAKQPELEVAKRNLEKVKNNH